MELKCPYCEKEFISKNNFYSHTNKCEKHPFKKILDTKTNICPFCKQTFKFLKSHILYCKNNDLSIKRITKKPKFKEFYYCKYCNKEYSNCFALASHSVFCKSNPQNQLNLQKSKELPIRLFKGKKFNKERKERLSKSMKKAVLDNPDSYSVNNVSGRVKNYLYNGFTLKGLWELDTAKWLDSLNINWTNKIDGITYFYENKSHLYFPDFYLIDFNLYIEVKGYEREVDSYKWKTLNNLIIFKKDEIEKIRKGLLTIDILKIS